MQDKYELPVFPPLPGAWYDHAACRGVGPSLFFVEREEGRSTKPADARKACAPCPVKADCLAYALDTGVRGIWGGTTEIQRKAMRRDRRLGDVA